jgi:hypothetical protein
VHAPSTLAFMDICTKHLCCGASIRWMHTVEEVADATALEIDFALHLFCIMFYIRVPFFAAACFYTIPLFYEVGSWRLILIRCAGACDFPVRKCSRFASRRCKLHGKVGTSVICHRDMTLERLVMRERGSSWTLLGSSLLYLDSFLIKRAQFVTYSPFWCDRKVKEKVANSIS